MSTVRTAPDPKILQSCSIFVGIKGRTATETGYFFHGFDWLGFNPHDVVLGITGGTGEMNC
jgi:hypothetical protein